MLLELLLKLLMLLLLLLLLGLGLGLGLCLCLGLGLSLSLSLGLKLRLRLCLEADRLLKAGLVLITFFGELIQLLLELCFVSSLGGLDKRSQHRYKDAGIPCRVTFQRFPSRTSSRSRSSSGAGVGPLARCSPGAGSRRYR